MITGKGLLVVLTTLTWVLATAGLAGAQPGVIEHVTSAVPVGEGAGSAMVFVERKNGTQGSVSVEYMTEANTATAGLDYMTTTGTLTWGNGDASNKAILVPILDDGVDEEPETFRVRLSNPQGGASLGIPIVATVTIIDDDDQGLCTSSPTTLCLNEGRYAIVVSFRTPQGATGSGMAQALTPNSGTFWFFEPSNVEMLIKVLDGCTINNFVWVFFAATTTVEFTVTVTDTETGADKRYTNSQGQPANAVTDIEAFSTCT